MAEVTPERGEPLTAREQEIADMAAAGLTSPEIAASLVVSVRTVDAHLGHVYAKLGIEGGCARVRLASLLPSGRQASAERAREIVRAAVAATCTTGGAWP